MTLKESALQFREIDSGEGGDSGRNSVQAGKSRKQIEGSFVVLKRAVHPRSTPPPHKDDANFGNECWAAADPIREFCATGGLSREIFSAKSGWHTAFVNNLTRKFQTNVTSCFFISFSNALLLSCFPRASQTANTTIT